MKIHIELLIFYLLSVFDYGRTQQLGMDKAYFTLNNTNYPDVIRCKYNLLVCEGCRFEPLFSNDVPVNGSQTTKISTTFPYTFEIYNSSNDNDASHLCRIDYYSFDEHGSYSLEVSLKEDGKIDCQIVQTKESGYYWTPVICMILFICCFVLIVQLCHHMYNSQHIGRILNNIGHHRTPPAINATTESESSQRAPSLIGNESIPEDLFGMRTSISELPLVGSTRSSNNTVRISKVLPKRLKSLDTFRGFSLMVMIFVNYGGMN